MAKLNVSCRASSVSPLSMYILGLYTHYTKSFILELGQIL